MAVIGLLLLSAGLALAAAADPFSWSSPVQIDHQYPYGSPFAIISMSCPSTGLCVGNSDQGGELVSSSNPTGSSKSDWSVLSTSLIAQDGTGYSLAGTSCVTTGSGPFCVAAGSNFKTTTNQGVVLTSTNPTGGASAWTPATFPVNLSSPSCSQTSSTTTCITSGYDPAANRGVVYVSTNPGGGTSSWTRVGIGAVGPGVVGAACASSTMCAALDGGGNLYFSTTPTTAASWSSASQIPNPGGNFAWTSFSCPTASFCIVDGGNNTNNIAEIATTTNPAAGASTTWTTAAESSLQSYSRISCSPDASLSAPHAICFAQSATGGVEVSIDGGAIWTAETVAAAAGTLDSYSCPADTLCVAGSSLGNVVNSANASSGGSATWSAPVTDVAGGISPVDLSPQSCSSSSLCVGSDGAGRILTSTTPANPSSWGVTMGDPGNSINGLACPSASLCVAIDSAGNVLQSTNPSGGGGTWSSPASIDNEKLYLLQCPSASLCVAYGNSGTTNDVLISTNPAGGASTWSKHSFVKSERLANLQCPSTSLCVATVANVPASVIESTNPTAGAGATWSAPATIDSGAFVNSLQCPSSSLCVATDNNGDVLQSTNPAGGAGTWSTPTQIDSLGSISGLRCPSSSLCFAWDGKGNLLTSTNPAGVASTWSSIALDTGNAITHVECATSSLCDAIDNAGNAFTTTNPAGGASAWSSATPLEAGVPLHRLACPSMALCVVTDSGGSVIAGTLSVPSNTALPTISGNLTRGQTLTEANGSWTNSPTSYAYQWQDCDSSGGSCTDISGATAQTYTLTAGDVGHTIRVQETASNAGGSSTPASSAATAMVMPLPPANTALPTISGNLTEGQTLTEAHGTWTNAPTSYSYQWQDCDNAGNNCSDIAGATAQTYTLTGSDVGLTIRVQETAGNAGGASTPASSAATAVVQPASAPPSKPVNGFPPVASGRATVGRTLSTSNGTWSGTPPLFAYRWQRCTPACADIAGAIRSTYELTTADVGTRVRVVVAAINSAGFAVAVSNSLGPVVPSAAQIKASLLSQLAPHGKLAKIAALLKHRGYTFTFKALSAGRVLIRWYGVPKGAHLASGKPKPKPVLVAIGRKTFTAAGAATIKIALTAAGKPLLKRAKHLKLTAKGVFTLAGGASVTALKAFTLNR